MKKLLATLLAAAMVLSMGVVAFAEDEKPWKIGETTYASLGDAVAAVEENGTAIIELTKDASGGGVKVDNGKGITLNLNNHTYTVGKPTVGSTGTETNGFQLLNGTTVTIKNGKIKASNYNDLKILIQNYCDLTLKDVTLDATESNVNYVASNNHGNVLITGNTNIIANEGKAAFDLYYWPTNGYGDGVSVTIDSKMTGTIKGRIEYGDDGDTKTAETVKEKAKLNILGGNFVGKISTYGIAASAPGIVVTNGNFSSDVSAYVPADGVVVNANGTYSVGADANEALLNASADATLEVVKAPAGAQLSAASSVKVTNNTKSNIFINGIAIEAGKNYESKKDDNGNINITIPASSLNPENISGDSLTLKSDNIVVEFDNTALNAIVSQAVSATNVELKVEKTTEEVLNNDQKDAIESRDVKTVISVSLLKDDGTAISNFNDGTVKVELPFALEEGTTASDYYVIYVADNGSVERVNAVFAGDKVILELNHFSYYAIVRSPATVPVRDTVTIVIGDDKDAPEAENKPVEENPNTGAPVFVGVSVGALAAAR